MGAEVYIANYSEKENNAASELVEWFSISGDMDDFIYYGEEAACSER